MADSVAAPFGHCSRVGLAFGQSITAAGSVRGKIVMTGKHGSGDRNIAHLPNGSRLHLQDRNPLADDTRTDLAKAAAVAAEFGLVFDCGLDDAAAIYDGILHALTKDASHRLLDRTRQLRRAMKFEALDRANTGKRGKILH